MSGNPETGAVRNAGGAGAERSASGVAAARNAGGAAAARNAGGAGAERNAGGPATGHGDVRPLHRCLALSGGVGGAKLALGLCRVLPAESLTVVCNTADDFDHLGLRVCPDLDTVMYTLAGISNRVTGWGQAHETWSFLEALSDLGGETWFRLGDRDLATHVERTRRLRAGETLTEVTAALCGALGIVARVLPMSDDPVRTAVLAEAGELSFQHYFVRDRCEPAVSGFRFDGIDKARPAAGFLASLEDDATAAVLICPSNPFVSVDPVLALDGVEAALREAATPVVAVSPIVGGAAIKGPAAKMMAELGMPVTATGVARHYAERDLLDGFVIDEADAAEAAAIEELGLPTLVTGTVMETLADRERLARETLAFALGLDPRRQAEQTGADGRRPDADDGIEGSLRRQRARRPAHPAPRTGGRQERERDTGPDDAASGDRARTRSKRET